MTDWTICALLTQAGFGKCCADFMINGNATYPDGYCQNTCRRCKCALSQGNASIESAMWTAQFVKNLRIQP